MEDLTIDIEEILKQPDASISDPDTIRQIALWAMWNPGNSSIYEKVKPGYEFAGLYPEKIKIFDILPEDLANELRESIPFLLCPCCKNRLVAKEKARLETGIEHVTDPNGTPNLKDRYVCSHHKCTSHHYGISWNETGELYCENHKFEDRIFAYGNDGPFGSITRRLNVEIYKKGVEDKKELFHIGPYKFEREFKYKANEDGDVLSKSSVINIWKRNDHGGYTKWTSGLSMILYNFKQFNWHWDKYNRYLKGDDVNEKTTKFLLEELRQDFYLASWDKRWWRIFSHWCNRNVTFWRFKKWQKWTREVQ